MPNRNDGLPLKSVYKWFLMVKPGAKTKPMPDPFPTISKELLRRERESIIGIDVGTVDLALEMLLGGNRHTRNTRSHRREMINNAKRETDVWTI
jgi:hypothetical protein